ncbi:MAG: hypothetical protein QM684_00290 [Rhizobium sp.]
MGLHAFLAGVPHRAKHSGEALKHIASRSEVRLATGGEIIDAYKRQMTEGDRPPQGNAADGVPAPFALQSDLFRGFSILGRQARRYALWTRAASREEAAPISGNTQAAASRHRRKRPSQRRYHPLHRKGPPSLNPEHRGTSA